MTKGFKDKDNKFHPTQEDDAKLSSRDVAPESQGLEGMNVEQANDLKERKFV